ncbi:MAG: AgmX/PglI C-terminal domain-containing protein [Polyangiaceae bacterium]
MHDRFPGRSLLLLVGLAGCATPTVEPTRAEAPAPTADPQVTPASPPTTDPACAGLPLPEAARVLFCARRGPHEGWVAALLPLEAPTKANARLFVAYAGDGPAQWTRPVLARAQWRRPPQTFDLDGDGQVELVLSVDGPNDTILRHRPGLVEAYPTPGLTIERFEDMSGDGRVDPVFRIPSPHALDCSGDPIQLSWLMAGYTDPEGKLQVDHPRVLTWLRETCPAAPTGPLAGPDATGDPREVIRCARLWGMTKATATQKVLEACQPFREPASRCEGPCGNLRALLAAAQQELPVQLATPPSSAPPPPPSGGALGRLDPAIIQQRVRAHHDMLRRCYEAGLANSPSLAGRVTVWFRIGMDGLVSHAEERGESDLPDPEVRACVVRELYQLTFPEPSGGPVTVSYPIVFTPSP